MAEYLPQFAMLYALGCLGIIGFQIALIAGAPLGHLTQGGQHSGALPQSGRMIAAVSILLLAAMALAILSVAGFWPGWPTWTGWLACAVSALAMLLNSITPSMAERRLWSPITTVMFGLALAVMLLQTS